MSEPYYEIWADEYGYTVKRFTQNGYERNSVLYGQTKIEFVNTFETAEEAQAAYPDANFGNKYISEQNSFDHLPDEGDGW